ncbi:17160_t:CDS:2, partial [Racocetra persica]
TQLQEAEVNYQQIKKELFEKQNNLIFLQEQGQSVSEELKLLGQKITELRQDLVQSEKNKNNLKKQLIQAEACCEKPTKIDKGKEKEVIVIVDNSLPEQEVSSEQSMEDKTTQFLHNKVLEKPLFNNEEYDHQFKKEMKEL